MDQSIKRRGVHLQEAYQKMRAEGRWPKPKAPEKMHGTVKMFPTEEARQLHLMQVAEAQAGGAPF